MNDIISIIGTVASIGSIPLAFYFFLKSKEELRDKVRREVVKIILYQLSSSTSISNFEITSVITSKCLESKIDPKAISIGDVISDLISEIFSNPLLDKNIKTKLIEILKEVAFPNRRIRFSIKSKSDTESASTLHTTPVSERQQDGIDGSISSLEAQTALARKSRLSVLYGQMLGLIGATTAFALIFDKIVQFFISEDKLKTYDRFMMLKSELSKDDIFSTSLLFSLILAGSSFLLALLRKRFSRK